MDNEGAILKYNFIYEYLFSEDECWRILCLYLRKHFLTLIPRPQRIQIDLVPMENILLVMSYMDAKSLANWGQTCRLFMEPALLDHFWELHCIHDFSISIHAFQSRSVYVVIGSRRAKQLYVRSYMRFREILHSRDGTLALPHIPIAALHQFITAH